MRYPVDRFYGVYLTLSDALAPNYHLEEGGTNRGYIYIYILYMQLMRILDFCVRILSQDVLVELAITPGSISSKLLLFETKAVEAL